MNSHWSNNYWLTGRKKFFIFHFSLISSFNCYNLRTFNIFSSTAVKTGIMWAAAVNRGRVCVCVPSVPSSCRAQSRVCTAARTPAWSSRTAGVRAPDTSRTAARCGPVRPRRRPSACSSGWPELRSELWTHRTRRNVLTLRLCSWATHVSVFLCGENPPSHTLRPPLFLCSAVTRSL